MRLSKRSCHGEGHPRDPKVRPDTGLRHFVTMLLVCMMLIPLLPNVAAGAHQDQPAPPMPCDLDNCRPIGYGDGLIVTSHRADVTIKDQIAVTQTEIVLFNPTNAIAEGTYLFPLPQGAAVSEFTMTVGGQPIDALLLDADEARLIYEQIVREIRDPALLEFVGRGVLQASVFPVQPGAEQTISIRYEALLTSQDGLFGYVYPLSAAGNSAQPIAQMSVRVAVQSAVEIRAVYSPSHTIATDRPTEFEFTAGWEASNVLPADDFALYFSVSDDAVGVNLLSTYDVASGEGHFLLLAAPGISDTGGVVARDIIVVLDTSGSMEGEKIVQARTAVKYVLEHLNPEDRFAIVEFSTGVRTYAPDLSSASEARSALPYVEGLQANGGTDINRALLEAMSYVDSERPAVVLFLTDGLPTEGETDPAKIIANVQDSAPANARVFPFGVGFDVDTILLDQIATSQGGLTTYVRPSEPLDEIVSGFWAQIGTPVLSDLAIDFGSAIVEDMHPSPLPDLYRGSQLTLAGRYRGGGPVTITLTGTVNGELQTFTYANLTLATTGEAGQERLPRLWATRRIGYLLNQIRLNGEQPELVRSVIDLSVAYGIVTPYTSYLITEDDILTQEGRDRAADRQIETAEAAPAAPTSGEQAVEEADSANAMSQSDRAADADETYAGEVRVAGSRAFVLQDDVWVETTFDPSSMTPIDIVFASDDYFALLAEYPDLAEAFAIGEQVIAVVDGQAYRVVPTDQQVEPAPSA